MLRRTELKRRKPLTSSTPLLRGSRLNPVSRKRQREMRIYTKLRAVFLTEHPRCEFPAGCTQPATEIQHRRGRRGARLCDVEWWAASCSAHNQFAETHTGAALDMGWLVRIEGAA